ncbi:MAG TPA: HD domain-containing protein [Longimicrobiales bacterium]|nr:HD domain-containing protein [Longimicrobiales bacterium]
MHPLLNAAAEGELPGWARAGERRRAHVGRVSELMGRWADELGLGSHERARWRAAGLLHDAFRDADPELLRMGVSEDMAGLPAKLLHGPAAAERLRRDGVDDDLFLRAIAYHTLGHPAFDRLGRALYLADYLDPGREDMPAGTDALRARCPAEMDHVIRDVASVRIARLLESKKPLRAETVAFWNAVVGNGP